MKKVLENSRQWWRAGHAGPPRDSNPRTVISAFARAGFNHSLVPFAGVICQTFP